MYVNVYVPKSGGSVVRKSDVYKCSDPSRRDIQISRFGCRWKLPPVGGDFRRRGNPNTRPVDNVNMTKSQLPLSTSATLLGFWTPPTLPVVRKFTQSPLMKSGTGRPQMDHTWLQECCRQIEAEVVSNSRNNKLHQAKCEPFAGVRYCVRFWAYPLSLLSAAILK